MSDTKTSERNTYYILTGSSYSDYTIHGLFIGPPGVDVSTLAKQYALEHPDKCKDLLAAHYMDRKFSGDHFFDYVVSRGNLTPVEHKELWVPDYPPDMAMIIGGE